ncbi:MULTISPECIES: enoyl-CoA hydratase/isomerase family protein [Tsukamurella]|uniref:Enoyl-CoA hydratase/isomerase family protein n=2 Tax=Tsukamurella TaxID=2060 RepID=A0A5C5RYR9_9ACTN|nr:MULTISPECIES: enoyl-CoA hydratase-related protein [Tsukamurella]NMD57268.1 enoyl-CoA hydratase/isomerase family protein [Tsukamurella columbiensis]TWS27822.1 enoyl-CoA hydratase/isomerase family protein [Tsukamurella conjunctivitidis]
MTHGQGGDDAGLGFGVDERGVATITLRRPDAANALNQPLADALVDATRAIAVDATVRVVVLRAEGRFFCAGGDVRAMVAAEDRGAMLDRLAGTIHDALAEMDRLAVPVVAAIQGPVAGGGLGLVLAADVAIAAETAHFSTAYAGVGLSPDCGVSALLPKAVGMRRALRMLLHGERIDAPTAASWELIDRAVPSGDLDAEVGATVDGLLAGPYPALGEARRLVRASYARSYGEQLDDERRTIARMGGTDAAAARLARFA